jgi:hypothetical protein
MKQKALLIAPAFGKGRGGGHLVRSAALTRELRVLGREAYIFIPKSAASGPLPDQSVPSPTQTAFSALPGEAARPPIEELLAGIDPAWIMESRGELLRRSWDWIILDRFQTPLEELKAWSALAPVIGIDEGGPARKRFDFLIDLLPGLPGIHPANLVAPRLLSLPENRRQFPFSFQAAGQGANHDTARPLNILVSFGAEDPAGLTAPMARALLPSRSLSGFSPFNQKNVRIARFLPCKLRKDAHKSGFLRWFWRKNPQVRQAPRELSPGLKTKEPIHIILHYGWRRVWPKSLR